MKKQTTNLLLVLLLALAPFPVCSQTDRRFTTCEVTIDLQHVTKEKDRVKVTVIPPAVNSRVIDFSFPSAIPGVYKTLSAIAFIHEVSAVDERGARVRVSRRGNAFRFHLRKGRVLRRVEYWVDDVFDAEQALQSSQAVPQAAASRFEAGTEFMLQPAFMIGRFSNAPEAAYRITVLHTPQIFATSALTYTSETDSRDKFFSSGYTHLIDHPVLYGTPDTLSAVYGHINLRIAVSGSKHEGRARIIRRILSPQLSAMQQLTAGDAPISFILMYRFDEAVNKTMNWSGVEHTGSGYFCLPDLSEENEIVQMITQQSEGSLLRMLPSFSATTALDPDQLFGEPAMVPEMWWFGNGMTAYLNLLGAVRDSVMSEEAFMEHLRDAISLADAAPPIAFSDQKALARALASPHQAAALRARALITVFLLDIELLNTSQTKADGLRAVFLSLLSQHTGGDNLLLAKLISESSGADVQPFFKNYVFNSIELPLISSLEMIGWAYAPEAIDSVLSFGNFTLFYAENNDAFYVRTAFPDNLFGLRSGDRILSVNGVIVNIDNFDYAMYPVYHPEEEQPVSLRFIRGNRNDEITVIPLLREEFVHHFVRIDPAAQRKAIANRNRLLHSEVK
jgi:predicted metalloprotease with PDZ domain